MAKELIPMEVGESPDLLQLAEDVKRSGSPRVLRRHGEDLAILQPAPTRVGEVERLVLRRKKTRSRAFTKDDALFGLLGIGKSGIRGGVSADKHEYLGRAMRHR